MVKMRPRLPVAHPFTGAPLVARNTSGAPVKGCATAMVFFWTTMPSLTSGAPGQGAPLLSKIVVAHLVLVRHW